MQNDPVEVALAAAEESGERSRRCYGYLLKQFRADKGREEGARLFVEECAAFVAEVAAGEVVRNKGAALNKRLGALISRLEPAPVKVSPPPKVEVAPVQAEPDPPPAVEAEKVEEENPAPPFTALVASKRTPAAELTPEEVAEKQRQAREGLARLKQERPELWGGTDG